MSFEAECLELCWKQLEATVAITGNPYSPSVWKAGIWRQWTLSVEELTKQNVQKACAAEWETSLQCMQLLPWRAQLQTQEGGMPAEHRAAAVVPGLCHAWLWFSQERPERIQLSWAGLGASPALGKETWTVWLSGLTPSLLLLYCILYLRRGVQWDRAFLVHEFSGSLLALPPCTPNTSKCSDGSSIIKLGKATAKGITTKWACWIISTFLSSAYHFVHSSFKAEKKRFFFRVCFCFKVSIRFFFCQCQVFLSKFFASA